MDAYRLLARLGWLDGLDPSWLHRAEPAPPGPVQIRFLGCTCFSVQGGGRTLVFDPYLSRPGLRQTALSRLRSDSARVRALLPHADDVLVGHAHHDHVLDAPELCRQTGARLIGSSAVGMVGRAAGLPESQIRVTAGREAIDCGGATVRGLPSAHGRVYFNRVYVQGDIRRPPPWPAHYSWLKHGQVLSWHVEVGGLRVVHIDTAEFHAEELAGLRADVLCLCAIGRRFRPHYVEEAVRLLRPRWVIPCHWDLITRPFEADPLLLPQVDLPGMLREIRDAGAEPVLLPFDGVFAPRV